ncbi:hypothetical protein AJ79_05239 [Helicocarpus griseus UAMH5409]|uniref:AB hydrolase-1 domain-containing protein n=1 Tax=Helicocarpus griseus UAMH5409 TaxID=1447875 RepID=A0A2B7XPH2_9EURO|nr:hypothetical protein AJ79_05239 [Helicocarpus griseus UAMH5409]
MTSQYSTGYPPPRISKSSFTVAGIPVTVYGLSDLPPDVTHVAVLWLLHPRLRSHECMEPIAAYCIHHWNDNCKKDDGPKGLIAISFDQRNHGSRLVDNRANLAWAQGNKSHAVDMFSIYPPVLPLRPTDGTAMDTSLLMDHIPSYLFPSNFPCITQNLCLGVSLGGHASWLLLVHEPRITAAVSVIGCPDYIRLMTDRARRSELESYTQGQHKFLGSSDFPNRLIDVVEKWDPVCVLLKPLGRDVGTKLRATAVQRPPLRTLLEKHLKGKAVLALSGKEDEDVPPDMSEPFINYLNDAMGKGEGVEEGWWEDPEFLMEDEVFEGVGHAFSEEMVRKAVSFVGEMVVKG